MSYQYNSPNKRPYSGGGGYGGGRGGSRGGGYGGGRGGGGRSSHRPFSNSQQGNPTEMKVLTNQNKLVLSSNGEALDKSDYVQYRVSMKNAGWKRVTDEVTGEKLPSKWEVRESTAESMMKFLKTPYPWRVMKKWQGEHNFEVAYDGAEKAYFPSAATAPDINTEFRVSVKKDCEEDDPDAERIAVKWYAVTFQKTNAIPFDDVMKVLEGGGSSSTLAEEISTMFTLILKSGAVFTRGMISLDPRSSMVFFPLHMQRNFLERPVNQETDDKTKILLSGLKMTAVFQRGGAYVETESIAQYANKEYFEMFNRDQRHRDGSRVPILNTSAGRRGNETHIAGVPINGAQHAITDTNARKRIEEAIDKKLLTGEYFSKKKDKWVLYKNKSLRRDTRDDNHASNGNKILWSACDPSLYSFEHDGEQCTVASFWESVHGASLKYPHMPIVHVDSGTRHKGIWLPIEFLYQAFTKSKENENEMVQNILKYHDVYAGKRYIEEVENKLKALSMTGEEGSTFRDRLTKWRITIDARAVEETAKILKPPTIMFRNSPTRVNNGSFNLARVTFSRPAKLTSFALVNFTNDRRSCYEYIERQMKVAQSHGMVIPSTIMKFSCDSHYIDLVTEHYQGRDPVNDALDVASRAIQKAKNFHLYDSQRFYRNQHVFFKTYCYSEQQVEFECLVLPPTDSQGALGLLLDYRTDCKKTQYYSHHIETRDGNKYDARIMVKIRETDTLIDPLDFRYENDRHEACRSNGSWQAVNFDKFCFECPQGSEKPLVFGEGDIMNTQFFHLAENWEVDFPSIVFVIKPTDDKPLYDRIKVMSNYFGGIPSQCVVLAKYKSQRGTQADQYASNIATKMNAKLSTIYDKAISWTSSCDGGGSGVDKLPWVEDIPTLVVGVGMVHGMGIASKSIVAASLCLDSGCMRLSHSCFIQKKSDIISTVIMKDIIKLSIKHYTIENGCHPERILFYRDGMSDGQMKKADDEISSIREALNEELGRCNIPITFVICQSQQLGFRMVPSITTTNFKGKKVNNVNSGTVLECDAKSFHMVAQGGLKGTSKPVKYIVHLNENEEAVKGHCGLTQQNLINCTNQMCLKYPTATKAVRELPVIKYAKRLANQVLSSISVLQEGCNWFGKTIRLVYPADDVGTEDETRPYLEVLDSKGSGVHPEHRQHNIVEMPFHNHLAA